MSDPVEIELKVDCDPGDAPRLARALVLEGVPGTTRRLVSTYFDTPDLALRGAGYSLRVRRSGARRIQTVKAGSGASAGLYVRPEWEHPIPGDQPVFDQDCGPLVAAVGAAALARIEPVFTTDIRRTAIAIEQEGAAIELAIDRGRVLAGDKTAAICEVELELRSGPPAALFDLARRLDGYAPLRLGVRSKSERGFVLAAGATVAAAKAAPVAIGRDDTAGDALQAIAQSCLRQFRLNETLLLGTGLMGAGGVEPVHQARVGLRRLRSALKLYKPALGDQGPGAPLRAELRWLAAGLGEVRNIDVLIPRFEGAGFDAVRSALGAARARMFDQVRTDLASARSRALMIDLAEWLSIGAWRVDPAEPALSQPVVPFVQDLLDHRRARLKRHGKGLAGLDAAHRHQVRIEAKTLRYAAEFFARLCTDDKGRKRHRAFVTALAELQDLLGDLNDLAIAPAVLAQHGIAATPPRSGRHRRRHLLDKAEAAYDTLMDIPCFWRRARFARD